ncbi:hypothetical protein [Streptomyces sp. NRRL B-24484]|uniref:hypothetical protein n=1 Tax=Streptomyces sp. NRRL B-24484 TaxID=1463833 RepID=UPI0004C28E75|nr:hypothetical protein [Streptomyces sp. NRRL B-24484]
MRLRLQAAVHALLADESVAGLPDAARLAAVVVYAKGAVETGSTVLWSGELARWLGVSISMVSHKVLPPLRVRGALRTLVVTNENGEPIALDLRLEPVARVRRTRDIRHPLALTRAELTTLMRLCEALFGPGWAPKDKAPTPPGVLALREREQRHGAATDRLALLLLVLSCRENGRLKLCSGSLKVPELGRGAATLALLLHGGAKPLTPVAADRVLARLEGYGAAHVERGEDGVPTGRVTLVPVAESFAAVRPKKKPAVALPAARPESPRVETSQATSPAAAPACPDAEAGEEARKAFSLPSVSTEGDLESMERVDGAPACLGPAETPRDEPPAAGSTSAEFHTPHALVVTPGGLADVVDGFSGARAVGVTHRQRWRGGTREEVPDFGLPGLRLVGAGDGPLRGEQHTPTPSQHPQQAINQVRRTPPVRLPRDAYLARALAPVEEVWSRLENSSTRRFVLKHVRAALDGVARWTGFDDAPEALADRLSYRLERQRHQGNPYVSDPVGWLLTRGLPQERQCSAQACDNSVRLDTGADCITCDLRVEDRRSTRQALIRQIVERTPDLSFEERQQAIGEGLQSHAMARAEAQADRVRREAAARERWEQQRPEREARAAEAERARLAVPCADCGVEQAEGLCVRCAWKWDVASSVHAAIDLRLAARADLSSRTSFREVWQAVRGELQERRDHARTGLEDQDGVIARGVVLLTMQHAVDEFRQEALDRFAASEAAVLEAEAAYDAVMRARHRYTSTEEAEETAVRRAEQARGRAAEWLLQQRLARVSDLRVKMGARTVAVAQPGRDRALEGRGQNGGTASVAEVEGSCV